MGIRGDETGTRTGAGPLSRLAAAFRRLFGKAPGGRRDGAYWENEAARFLRSRGYRIIARNIRMHRGELDIIAAQGEETVFVEVKQRKSDEFGGGLYAVDFRKRHRLLSAAKEFLSREGLTDRPCRFDTVIIDTSVTPPAFNHIENAFEDERR